ncbi:class I SAM-dependent methyltransferase [Mycolicibacterium mucogenicum]|jgi:SAM-dependent methyltransferase|uniref:class I SAM-dependent methyltransferase n=1 Tax=Mycolicibacterium mucogenicum TaxID=56689 RepID=UPI00226AC355|nr:class I SAM-dependent methyltransferase [Mycolicibacterium mucogenicum]MCX8559943.1 class I SAM-dependent methyltransferase [Mycolicibacterium mucogenicum]
MPVDEDKLNEFLGMAIGDMGAAMSASLILLGDRLGLYKALAPEPLTSTQLAEKTGTVERYVREWLANQAAGGYVQFDPDSDTWSLSPEQAACLADPNGPVDIPGAYNIIEAVFHVLDRTTENFRTGGGLEWGEHHPCLFAGTERFFRAGYNQNLISSWLPALDGAVERLETGAKVADVGCGHGVSTILMAKTYPNSTFIGYDYHPESIRVAAEHAEASGTSNALFEVADATSYADNGFDLIAFFDCLHDMGDPVGAMRHTRAALKDDGIAMIVEPFAGDRVQDNLNPIGRMMYGASSQICVPVSLARNGPALGAQAGEARLRDVVVDKSGFTRFRRATETPFNLVFEARP